MLEPFTYICDFLFSSGMFLQIFKIAKMIPIFRTGDVSQFNESRPMSMHRIQKKITIYSMKDEEHLLINMCY